MRQELIDINVSRMVAAYRGDAEVREAGQTQDNDLSSDQTDGEQLPRFETSTSRIVAAVALTKEEEATLSAILERVLTDTKAIYEFFASRLKLLEFDHFASVIFCGACLDLGRFEEAQAVLNGIPSDWDPRHHAILNARLLIAHNRHKDAADVLKPVVSLPPHEQRAAWHLMNRIWLLLLEVTIATESADAAVQVLQDWKVAMGRVKSVQAYRQVALASAREGNAAAAEAHFNEGLDCSNGTDSHLIADYIEFLGKQGRRTLAAKYLPLLDVSKKSILKRKQELEGMLESTKEATPAD